ncbi:NmrA family NAD(P)-binding protein [Bradyrhizobium sp. Ce-3]|uniref:NmrA family NAD(P)-binding protein n=1 Tax=Bradyrhizobium sp. Ce-3 TaxID=2913970 RepID=UPI001FC82D6E|nr:NmrA family NAD(P)-binding protein [Bradyrhizobium sp. Ce-3]GKQ52049.1 NAD(P)-dependent oxidoreductase [Bradyrhizobium sp. Ce-3]
MSKEIQTVSHKPRIAIAGATGRVGSTLASLLASDPVDITVLTRRPDAPQLPKGASIAAVDFDQPDTLQNALRGTDRLFVSHGTSPRQVANEIALIDAAVAAGVRHIVKLSALGPASRLNPFAWHMQIEAHLAQQPVASTVLRPSAYVDILKRSADQIAAGSWAGAAGEGSVNFIDTRDVASVARVALLEEFSPESQRAYHLTGTQAWTMPQVAEQLSNLLGHPVVYSHRSTEEQRATLLADGLPPLVADLLVGLDQMFRESALGETTSTVELLTGKSPRTLPQWLAENIEIFRNSTRHRAGATPEARKARDVDA